MDFEFWKLSWSAAIDRGEQRISDGDFRTGFQMVTAGRMRQRFDSTSLINLPTQRQEDSIGCRADLKAFHWGANVQLWLLWPRRRPMIHSSYVLTLVNLADCDELAWSDHRSRMRLPALLPPQIVTGGWTAVDCAFGIYLGEEERV